MGTMDLIALKADPAALAKSAFQGADQAGRGAEARPGFDSFADILAASEAARKADRAYEQAFDDSGMDDLEEESLLEEMEEDEKSVAEDDKPRRQAPADRPATVTEFLPFDLRPQMLAEMGPALPGMQQQLMATTATPALAGGAQGDVLAPAAVDGAAAGELQAGLALGANGRAAWRQDALADAAVRRGDKREALIQPAAAGNPTLGTVFGKGTAPGTLILAAGEQVGGQGQNGNSGSQSNMGGQNGQTPTQFLQSQPQAQTDPAGAQARADQFAAALAGQGREAMAREAAALRAAPANGGGEALRAEAAGSGSQSAAQAAGSTSNPAQALGQAEQAQRPAPTQAQQAVQQARMPMPQPPVEQVAVRIAAQVRDGMDMIRIQLEPADLGRVDVRLHMQDGAVTAVVTADNQDTLDLLQRDSRSLQQALQDAGLKTDSNGLSFSLRDDGRGAPTGDDKGGSQLAGKDDGQGDAGLVTAEADAAAPQWHSDRALDIVA